MQYRRKNRQITVRRFGWSDVSQAEAQAHAERRAQDALDGLRDGEQLARREPKVAYNGADGVPIREEIVARHDDVLITRNGYGCALPEHGRTCCSPTSTSPAGPACASPSACSPPWPRSVCWPAG